MKKIEISLLQFLLGTLAVFRLTRLIVFDKITSFIRKPFHEIVEETESDGTIVTFINIKGTGLRYWIGELLSCYWCVGIWCSIFIVLVWKSTLAFAEPFILILAVSAVAAFFEMIVQRYFIE